MEYVNREEFEAFIEGKDLRIEKPWEVEEYITRNYFDGDNLVAHFRQYGLGSCDESNRVYKISK